MAYSWPEFLPVGAVRFARPTARFEDCLVFYRDVLELPVIASWRGHDGYDGAVFGLPGTPVHLELTQHGEAPRIPSPSTENQLVLYLSGPDAVAGVVERLSGMGLRPADLDNAYWAARGAVAFADPDGWMVVLAPWVFGVDPVPPAASA
ncbi:VOC family protein [Nonomuraea phyllanthi]|jgi:catechol 2,3-dioxygenase-like lactoylglutathione lyase family enzyme|uniref:VOC family protein n=1 Tax=Nonomuraea phyllanthi TaxID=2219224 RepID=A0A5C4WJX9_9ACTN|nr:VOC family protein [Nonomuraea phyllanthi]KAB8194783.1 VOC family protein [Nonomuraea phyllanthi]QFY09204.1 VOC family protein [Nonomuraea phyllanthi]